MYCLLRYLLHLHCTATGTIDPKEQFKDVTLSSWRLLRTIFQLSNSSLLSGVFRRHRVIFQQDGEFVTAWWHLSHPPALGHGSCFANSQYRSHLLTRTCWLLDLFCVGGCGTTPHLHKPLSHSHPVSPSFLLLYICHLWPTTTTLY